MPVVHAKFADIGEDRGMGRRRASARQDRRGEPPGDAARAAAVRHNNVVWALRANSVDATGRPLPPPQIKDTDGTTDDDGTVTLGDDRILKLPGMSELESLVPNINYEAALHVLQDHMVSSSRTCPS
jgi:hypothetical protein